MPTRQRARAPTATAYAYVLESVLTFRFRWPSLLPSLEMLGAVLNDPGGAIEELLTYLGSVVRFVNFDPEYFMRGIDTLSAVNFALSLLKLLATYSSKAFAAVEAAFRAMQLS